MQVHAAKGGIDFAWHLVQGDHQQFAEQLARAIPKYLLEPLDDKSFHHLDKPDSEMTNEEIAAKELYLNKRRVEHADHKMTKVRQGSSLRDEEKMRVLHQGDWKTAHPDLEFAPHPSEARTGRHGMPKFFPPFVAQEILIVDHWLDSKMDCSDQLIIQSELSITDLTLDYRSMVFQVGYVLMFTVAWSLAPLMAAVANVVEIQMDGVRVILMERRPIPRRPSGDKPIGCWEEIMQRQMMFATIVAIWFFVFSTGSLDAWARWFWPDALVEGTWVDGTWVEGTFFGTFGSTCKPPEATLKGEKLDEVMGPNMGCFGAQDTAVRFGAWIVLKIVLDFTAEYMHSAFHDMPRSVRAAKDKIELKQRETMAGTLFPDLQEGGYSPNHLSAKSKSFYLGPKMANYDAAPAYVALPAKHYEPPVHDMRQTKIGHQRPTLSKHAAPKASGSYMPSVSSEASEDAAVEN